METDAKKLFDITDRICVITGGGGELCGTMAEALGQLGVRVALLDLNLENIRKKESAIKKMGGQAMGFGCDVLNESQLQEVLSKISELWGEPDFLINGAGGNAEQGTTSMEFMEVEDLKRPKTRGFFDLDMKEFKKVFDLNFFGTIFPTKVFSRGMVRKGRGSIINISSISALTPLTKVGAYSAAKAAVVSFTSWLAVHFSHTGVRVNAIAPGFFMTEQLRFLHIDQKTGKLLPRAKRVIAQIPMGNYGNSEDLISTIVWLLSDSSRYITGTVIPVDGGFSSFTI